EVYGYSKLAELITDGGFKDGTSGSFTVTGGENVDADFSENYLKADIRKQCGEGDAVLTSAELRLLSGQEYEVSFMAGATADRSIKAAFVDSRGNVLKEQQINLTTATKKQTFTYQADKDVTARLKLSLGGSEEVICIDTVRCDIKGYPASQRIDTEAHDIVLLEKKMFPVISEMTADEAIEGKDIVLTFKKNDDYKNAIKTITVNGVEAAENQYTITDGASADEYAITLDKSLFAVIGKRQVFNIVVNADWYQDNVIKQTVYRKQEWTPVWFEEFDGTQLDMTKWSYQDGTGEEYGNAGWGNNEQQYYTRDNLKVTDGELVITAKKERRGNNDYTSARIWTMEDDQKTPKFSKTDGRMEAKMKLGGGEGYEGIWPAFWMLPVDTSIYGAWPLSGEIDILETRGREPDKVDGTVHFGKPWPNNESKGGVFEFSNSANNTDSDINDYHIYAVEWEPGEIRWYVDDELYFTFSSWYSQSADKPGKYKYPAPFDQDFYIILNLAVGGSFDENRLPDDDLMPVDMKVDYVRVYDSSQPYKEVTKEPTLGKDEETDITSVKTELYDKDFEGINIYSSNEAALKSDVWNLATLEQFGGSADFKTITEDGQIYAKITPQALGSAAHSIQLMQNLMLVKGYNYRISFDARTDGKRKLNMKIGQDGSEGWDTHETFETTLSGTMQHYSYEFQAKTTDKHARVEFNLGTSMQPVYIGNITYELIGEIVTEEDGRKKPCDDQNYVYNGSFNIGDLDGLTYWHNDNSDGKVVREGTGYVFTAAKGNLYQYGLELLQNDTYELTFSARADAEREVKVSFTNISGRKIYKDEEVTVSTAGGTQKIVFTMPEGVSDQDAKLCFDFGDGGSKVYLTDIFLKRTSYNNIDWGEVSAYPLLNGDFELGSLYWSNSGDIGLAIKEEQGGHYAQVNAAPCANIWDRMLIYGDLHLTGKTDYIFSFDVRAGKETDALLVTMEDAGYYQHVSKPNLQVGTDWTHYEYDLRFTDDMDLALKFQIGGVSEACTMDFRNVRLSAVGAPKEPGTLKTDNIYNKLGEKVVFSYSGEKNWTDNAVVYVDGMAVAADKAVFKDGKLTLAADVFTEPKVYAVTIKAAGYTPVPELNLKMYPSDGDRIYNGGFVYGLDGWDQYLLDAGDEISWEDGKVKIHYGGPRYDWGNLVSWAIQFFREGIPVEKGKKYQISFIAYATVNRPIQVMQNQGTEISDYISITAEPEVYEIEFESLSDSLKLQFLLSTVAENGGTITADNILKPHDIYLDNICIKEIQSDGSVTVDKTALVQLIEECDKIERGDYTQETWEAFGKALTDAKAVQADTAAKQAEVNMARDTLLTAKQELAKPITKEALQAAIKEYENTERGDYTKTTWNVFQAALNTAKEVMEKETAKQDEIDSAKKKLEEAFSGLKEIAKAVKTAKEALKQTIELYQNTERGNYTQKSWNAFKAALKTAQDVEENEEESEDRIDVARENLEKAYAALEENKAPADKTELAQLIEKYDKVGRGSYTQETWDAFLAALEAAEAVAKDEDADQREVDAARDALEAAYRGLKEAGGGSEDPGDTENPDDPEKPEKPDDPDKEGLWAVDIDPVTYTGKAIKPELIVYDGNTLLKAGKDYTVSYKNNTKVGTAVVTIKGKGNYTGTITKDFEITAKSLADADIVIPDLYVMAPQGKTPKAVVPKPTVTRDGKKLKLKTEYIVECIDKAEGAYIAPGTYDVQISAVEGKGYTGSRVIKITLADPADQVLMSKAGVAKIPNQPYNKGEAVEPEVSVKMGKDKLTLGTDYTVSYDKNKEVGTAEVIVKGTGEKYVGEKRITFKITGTALKAGNVTLTDVPAGGYIYTGKPITPQVSIDGLSQDEDYTVDYQKNTDKGTATVLVKGIGAYTGTVKKTFKIAAYRIDTNTEQKFRIVSENITVPYAKGKCKPSVEIVFGDTILKEGTDYTLSYKNNDKANAAKQPEIYIKGKGNYAGTAKTTFTITKQSLGNLEADAADTLEKNAKKYNKVNPVVTDLDGKKLKKGTDYIVTGYTYADGGTIDETPTAGDKI
ncbi:MAG: carbohydrate binding domain-containing protein, partial [Lachnospiraceae bacterium]|nr:carbohydrate binding domain-containing protein [Lachnospiraceae bacterium]